MVNSFNTKEYAWIDVQVFLLGRPVTGLRAIAYKTKRQKEPLYAAGKKPRGIQYGKKEVDGTITLLQSELIALNRAAQMKGYDDISDIDFDVIVSYVPENGIVQTDKIVGVSITEVGHDIKEGDLYQEVALPFIACDIEFNVI